MTEIARDLEVLKFQLKIEIEARDHSNTSFYISKPSNTSKLWYAMVRVSDLGGTDYGYFYPMNLAEAKSLVADGFLEPWFSHKDELK